MTTLVHAASAVRKGARLAFGYVTAGSIAVLVLLGAFGRELRIGFEHLVLCAAFLGVALGRIVVRARDTQGKSDDWLDFELGCLLFAAGHALLQRSGGLLSPLYPLLYLLAALTGSFAARAQTRLLLLTAVVFEAPLYFITEGHRDPKPFVLHALFLAVFGATNALFTGAELLRLRVSRQRERSAEQRQTAQEVRLFRLAAKPPTTAARDQEQLWRASASEVKSSVHWNLALLKHTLELNTALLMLRDPEGGLLHVVAAESDSADLWLGPFATGEGAVGAAFQRGVLTNLDQLRPGHGSISYYVNGSDAVRAFVAVPVREEGEIIGVLCADRIAAQSFSPQEEQILQNSVEHLLRALENERVFIQLEHNKREQDVLYEASQALGAASHEQAVLDAALAAVGQLVVHDFLAVTHYDGQTRQHSIRCAFGEGAERVRELRFPDNSSLTAMVVKNRHYLPYRGEFDAHNQAVFTRSERLQGMHSVLILPLCVRDTVIGTLVLAARRAGAFPLDVRPALQLLANQLAVSLGNVASVARLEELATTDGLTGCFNKRHFTEELGHRLHAAQRFGRKVSLVIVDIDHFKSVNDKYGHHIGDVVIRELGQILRRLRRGSDLVARFGGEEFCVLCDQTAAESAGQLAERIRVELGQTTFDTELGPLQVTCSLGVATYPEHAASQDKLFEAADRALYAAKHAGRNQVSCA